MTLTEYMCRDKEEEDLLVLKTVLTHQCNNLKTTSKAMVAQSAGTVEYTDCTFADM